MVHPVYLNASMMLDFLADFDDGVSFTSDVAQRVEMVRKGGGEVGGTAGVADLVGLSLSSTGKLTRERSQNETTENKLVREHTVASLFNRLRNKLDETGDVVKMTRESLVDGLEVGTLVEVTGVASIGIRSKPCRRCTRIFVHMLLLKSAPKLGRTLQ